MKRFLNWMFSYDSHNLIVWVPIAMMFLTVGGYIMVAVIEWVGHFYCDGFLMPPGHISEDSYRCK